MSANKGRSKRGWLGGSSHPRTGFKAGPESRSRLDSRKASGRRGFPEL